SLARHARDLSEHKLIRDQISQHGYGEVGKGFDDLLQTVGFFEVFGHETSSECCRAGETPPLRDRFSHGRSFRSLMMCSMVSTTLAASESSIFTGTTASGLSTDR